MRDSWWQLGIREHSFTQEAEMLYASHLGELIRASKGAQGSCPGCGSELIPKCGDTNAHHWAHVAGDCDSWHEPEGLWHLGWKSLAPQTCTEVVMGTNREHRADIRMSYGLVVELQASPLSASEILEREAFYKDMIWLLDARGGNVRKASLTPCCELVWTVNPQNLERGWAFQRRCHHPHAVPLRADGVQRFKNQPMNGWAGQDVSLADGKDNLSLRSPIDGDKIRYEWLRRRKPFDVASKPVFLDTGDGVLEVTPRFCKREGYGFTHSYSAFTRSLGLRDVHPTLPG